MSRWLKLLLTWMLALALPLQALAAATLVHCGGHGAAGHHLPPGMAHAPAGGGERHGSHADVHGQHAHAQAQALADGRLVDATSSHAAGSSSAGPAPGAEAPSGLVGDAPSDAAQAAAPDLPPEPTAAGLHGKCSACAACCGVLALPSADARLGTVAPDEAYAAAADAAPAGHVPAGDERPPRRG